MAEEIQLNGHLELLI